MHNPNIESFSGQILRGENNRNKRRRTTHVMVYLSTSPLGDEYFEGAMLTSTINAKYNNVLIPEELFLKADSNGKPFVFPIKPTAVRPCPYIKKNDWAPFVVVGQLTESGVAFVKKAIGNMEAIFNENNEE